MKSRACRVALIGSTLAIAGIPAITALGACWVAGVSQDACTSYNINCTTPGGTQYPCLQQSSSTGCSVSTVVPAAIGYSGKDGRTSSEGCSCTYALKTCHPTKQQCVDGGTSPTNTAVNVVPAGSPCTGTVTGD